MINPDLLLRDYAETLRRLGRKRVDPSEVAAARDAILERNRLQASVERLRSDRKRLSKEIGTLMGSGRRVEAEALKAEVATGKASLEADEERLRNAEMDARDRLLRLPNLPADEAPDGKGEEDNVVLRTVGYDHADYAGRTWLPHWEVADRLGILEQERAGKVTGSMFAMLRGDGSKLLRALVDLAFRLNEETYEEWVVPTMVNSATFTGTGHLPKFAEEAYRVEGEDYWLIPTGEVPLTGLHRDEILPPAALPLRYMTYTSCFRREAGAAGKDTRGMQRLHEFHKVELVRLCRPEDAEAEFEAMLADAVRPIELLGLPYRLVDLCAGDLTFSSQRVIDIEVYSPGVDRWLEVSSVGIFGDFQMRRSNIRFRRGVEDKPEFPYALNGSGLATPRVWAAVLEHYQQADGTVAVPSALRAFFGRETLARRG
jgi:seryl-tRNA synthetase